MSQSKYEPLRRYLSQQAGPEAPMTFQEVEAVLGFDLPNSARSYPAWWSNSVGTHVNAAAWREAGWKTSRVDLGSERVTFIRDDAQAPPRGMEDSPAIFTEDEGEAAGDAVARPANARPAPASILVPLEALSRSALHMIDDYAEEAGLDRASAAAAILEASAAARRRQLLESLPVASMPAGHDGSVLIREDRDARWAFWPRRSR